MKKILVLTNIYPTPDLGRGDTHVVHYFTKEWVRMGYDVRVVHYPVNFPRLVMWFASFFQKQLSSFLGATVRTFQAKGCNYVQDSVKIKRIPLTKYKLHGSFSKRAIDKAYETTVSYIESECFVPDVIISHWVNPQLEIMERLKQKIGCKTCYVAHTSSLELDRIYNREEAQKLIDKIDIIGFRSAFIQKSFMHRFRLNHPFFYCYSGIPEKYIPKQPIKRDFKDIRNFVFVGTLIKRKFPAEILLALEKSYGKQSFNMNYIGEGLEIKRIVQYAKELKVVDKVHHFGYLQRDLVVRQLQTNDVFVMVSKSETFGLVYLEAMAQGLITIASRDEGFDGIIVHGINGFLCEAGNIEELASLITEIRKLSSDDLKEISKRAIETAKSLTDRKVAKKYINEVEHIFFI